MRFFASAAALPSAAATGLARDAKRGCCGAKRPLASATSSAQVQANMIFVFRLALNCPFAFCPRGKAASLYQVRSSLASLPRGQYESVVAVHEAAFCYLRLSQKNHTSRAGARSLNMHPEGASHCPWGNHRALLQFICTQGSALRVQVACLVSYRPLALAACSKKSVCKLCHPPQRLQKPAFPIKQMPPAARHHRAGRTSSQS